MSEVVKLDEDTIKIIVNASRERTITIERLLADKAELEDNLASFDQRALDRKTEVIAKLDAQVAAIKQNLQNNLSDINELIQKAVTAGIILP